MGKAVEKMAHSSGDEIVTPVHADVCIDFSHPDLILRTLEKITPLKLPLVIGTTGWYEKLDAVQHLVEKNDLAVIYAQNFSLGMNRFLQLVKKASALLENYDVAISETHHKAKVDRPSGTALALNRALNRESVDIASIRVGAIPGTHSIVFNTPDDTITLTHQAHNRLVWAKGALEAAKWIQGKKGFFHLNDMLCT